jgi:hypothetical protein
MRDGNSPVLRPSPICTGDRWRRQALRISRSSLLFAIEILCGRQRSRDKERRIDG